METLVDVWGLYGGGGGGAEEPPVGGRLEDGGGAGLAEGPWGVGPLLGVGGRGFSLLWADEDAFSLGVGGALPRPPLLKGGGGGGAELLCFIPLPREEEEELLLLLLGGREMSGSDGRWERWSDGVDSLSDGDGEPDLPVGGRGAAALEPGGRSADLPTEPPAAPSVRKKRGARRSRGKASARRRRDHLDTKIQTSLFSYLKVGAINKTLLIPAFTDSAY